MLQWNSFQPRFPVFKGTVNVILSDFSYMDQHVRFTREPLKALYDQEMLDHTKPLRYPSSCVKKLIIFNSWFL